MAVPTFVTDMTTISACENTTDWNAYGGLMSPTSSTDYFRQGTQSVSGDAKGATGRRVIAFDHSVSTGTVDFTAADTYLYMWVWVATQPLVDTIANDGVAIYVSSSSGADTNYAEYTIGGSNAAWVGKGWKLFILDINNETADVTSGTLDKTAVAQFGLTVRLIATLGKSDGFAVDIMRYGSKVELTGGTSGDPISFQTIADQDSASGADTHYGVLYEDALGNKQGPNGCMIIGDEAGASNTWLASSDEILLVDQERVPSLVNCLVIDKDTGTTTCRIGTEVGSGDNSRGVGGGLMKAIGTADFLIDASLAFDEFSWWGGLIDGAGSILLQNTNVEWVSCTVQNSGQIVLDSGAELREGFIIASIEASGVGAILLNANPTTPEFRDMGLINNVHAIESETSGPTTRDLRNIQFAGNTADFRFNHTTGLLTINVLEGGDTPTTSDGGGGGTVEVVNAVPVKVTVRDATSLLAVENARVLAAAVAPPLNYWEGVTATRSGSTATVTHVAHGLKTGQKVLIQGADPNNQNQYNGIFSITVTGVDTYTYTMTGTPATPVTGVDSYSETNQDATASLYGASLIAVGQTTTPGAGTINAIRFYMKKTGSPTGFASAILYSSDGGSPAEPSILLAASSVVDVSTLGTSYAWQNFAFPLSTQNYLMATATEYVAVVIYLGGDVSNTVDVGYDSSSSTHTGNSVSLSTPFTAWASSELNDVCFNINALVSTSVILDGLTSAAGVVEDTAFNYTADQSVWGRVRRGTTSPLYKTQPLTGTILGSGFDVSSFMVTDE